MAKQCLFMDFNVHIYLENYECTAGAPAIGDCPECVICSPRNIRLIATGENDDEEKWVFGDPQRLTLSSTHLVHVLWQHDCIPARSIKVKIERAIECGNGCDPGWYAVPVDWACTGMMLPPGEYTFSIQDQIAHNASKDDVDTDNNLTLLFEPVSRDIVDAVLYNSACCR